VSESAGRGGGLHVNRDASDGMSRRQVPKETSSQEMVRSKAASGVACWRSSEARSRGLRSGKVRYYVLYNFLDQIAQSVRVPRDSAISRILALPKFFRALPRSSFCTQL
jgi:hypothetical protein